tara:strand:- start:726 stop:1727 length:1002 start_codon:yes stop_codon:yes gene_type:complete
MKKIMLILFLPLLVFSQTEDNNVLNEEFFVMFYNVENLFDTIDSPITNDSEFLPKSKKKWNTYRYNYKLRQLERVFASISKNENKGNMPDIIGLCEVENRLVVEDLLNTSIFNNQDYSIIHQDSPDGRGIDCALLFNNKFKLIEKDFIVIENPSISRPTRDIVYVKLNLYDKIINVFVNHWPSRWGGQAKSNHKRVFAAQVLKDYINLHTSENEYTIILGDFNDYPSNESISELLLNNQFINLMSSALVSGKGSYNYKGNWNWIDQIIISKNFKAQNIKLLSAGAFKKDFMLYTNKRGEVYPSRSFGGNTWYGGFSDHLPIYFKSKFDIRIEK